MRRGNENGIILEDDRVLAINLGSDFCAEHEWGIKKTRQELGVDDTKVGLEKRLVTEVPKELVWHKGAVNVSGQLAKQSYEGFWLKSWDRETEPHEIYFYRGATLATAWSDGDFGAFSTDAKQIAQLREIYDAIIAKDAVVWLGGGGVFQNAGLVIAVASRLPSKVTEAWITADNERTQLLEAAQKAGIEARLREAKKGFSALSPRWEKGVLKFLMNPYEQDKNNWGIYTVDELDQWIAGVGPVPKVPEPKGGKGRR